MTQQYTKRNSKDIFEITETKTDSHNGFTYITVLGVDTPSRTYGKTAFAQEFTPIIEKVSK